MTRRAVVVALLASASLPVPAARAADELRSRVVPIETYGDFVGLAFTADGRRLVTAAGNAVQVRDAATGKPTAVIKEEGESLAVSADGRTAALGKFGEVALLDLAAGKAIANWETTDGGLVTSIAISPDGKTVATGGRGAAVLWDAATHKPRATLKQASESYAVVVAFSPDGKTIAVGAADKSLKLWDAAKGSETKSLAAEHGVLSLAFSPDGKLLAVGDSDASVTLFDLSTGQAKATYKGTEKGVSLPRLGIAVAPDGRYVAAANIGDAPRGAPDPARLWDAAGTLIAQPAVKDHDADLVAFSPDGKTLAVGANAAFRAPPQTPAVLVLYDLPAGAGR